MARRQRLRTITLRAVSSADILRTHHIAKVQIIGLRNQVAHLSMWVVIVLLVRHTLLHRILTIIICGGTVLQRQGFRFPRGIGRKAGRVVPRPAGPSRLQPARSTIEKRFDQHFVRLERRDGPLTVHQLVPIDIDLRVLGQWFERREICEEGAGRLPGVTPCIRSAML